jgi:hypothetical protein
MCLFEKFKFGPFYWQYITDSFATSFNSDSGNRSFFDCLYGIPSRTLDNNTCVWLVWRRPVRHQKQITQVFNASQKHVSYVCFETYEWEVWTRRQIVVKSVRYGYDSVVTHWSRRYVFTSTESKVSKLFGLKNVSLLW